MNGDDPHVNERQSLLTRLLDAVKQCQVRFGGRTELATDTDSRVSCLCSAWESVLQHGLRNSSKALSALKQVTEITGLNKVTDKFTDLKNLETQPAFWQYVREVLTKHEVDRFLALKNISSDAGRGRAWLRSSLNEHCLERYMHMLIENDNLLSQFYESWAFLRDQERSSMMPMMAAGLGSMMFAINIDNPELNTIRQATSNVINIPSSINIAKPASPPVEEPRPVIAGETPPNEKFKKDKKKKKKVANIVSFEEDDSGTFSASQLSEYDQSEAEQRALSGKTTPYESSTSLTGSGGQEFSDGISDNMGFSPLADEETRSHPSYRTQGSNSPLASKASIQREPSVSSSNSLTRPPSQGSFSSADFDLSDAGGPLIPVNSGGPFMEEGMLPLVSPQESRLSVSSGSGTGYSGEDVKTAAFALAMAQKGFDSSHRTDGDGSHLQDGALDSNSTTDLKQAVIAMMVKKDEVEEQNKSLRAMLEQEMDTSSTLRAEIEEMKISFASQQEKEESKLQALQKENELLKHQLRKYVNAVQMLRTEGSQADASLGIHLDEVPQPTMPPEKELIDYSHEASEYEQKLIQVAEMHGELMEFNEMLHRQLNAKEAMLRRLQHELTDLRGPLPHDLMFPEDGSGLDCLSLQSRTLINIWIPSAFMRGGSSDSYHVYQVYVRIKDEEWNVYKRYSQFRDLHVKLKKLYPLTGKFEFPPKKTLGNKDSKVVESRRRTFQIYLRNVLNHIIEKNETLGGSNACKEKLIEVLPFFSDKLPEKPGKKKKKKSTSGPSPLSNSPEQQEEDQPEYTGL